MQVTIWRISPIVAHYPRKSDATRFVRHSKTNPHIDEVDLTDITPSYAHIRHMDGRESTVALRDLATCPSMLEVQSVDIPPDENFELNNDENPPQMWYRTIRRNLQLKTLFADLCV